MADYINRYVRLGGIKQVILVFYALSLVLMEWLHTLGLATDVYLAISQLLYSPIVWLIDNDCCPWWLGELLKLAAGF